MLNYTRAIALRLFTTQKELGSRLVIFPSGNNVGAFGYGRWIMEDSAIGITKNDEGTYEWPEDQLLTALSVRTSPAEKLSLWHSRLGHLNFATLRTYLRQLQITISDDVSRHFPNCWNRS